MKRLQGLIAAALITAVVALGMVGIGVSAAANPNSVPVSNSLAAVTTDVTANATAAELQAQVNQLQDLVKQYQSREQQYQTEIKTLSQKASDANTVVNQAQQILQALQERGLIQITRDGRILLRGD